MNDFFKKLFIKKQPVVAHQGPMGDVDAMSYAYRFMNSPVGARQWSRDAVIARPLGRLAYEPLSRLSVFAIPFAMVASAYVFGDSLPVAYPSMTAAVLASVPAVLVGRLLANVLNLALASKLMLDRAADFGRYELRRILSIRSGLPPESFSRKTLTRMAMIYIKDHYPALRNSYIQLELAETNRLASAQSEAVAADARWQAKSKRDMDSWNTAALISVMASPSVTFGNYGNPTGSSAVERLPGSAPLELNATGYAIIPGMGVDYSGQVPGASGTGFDN